MLSRLRSHLTYANVVATLALFLALGGGAYAAATIGSAQVIDDSLRSVDLKDNRAVGTQDVVNDNVPGGGLTSSDLRDGAVLGRDIANGTVGDGKLSDPGAFVGATLNFTSTGTQPDEGWLNYGGGWAPAAYRKERGRVFLQGLVRYTSPVPGGCEENGAQGDEIFTLPAGYRPATGQIFGVEAGNGQHARVDVESDGQVRCQYGPAKTYLSLSGIDFVAGR
jgi:hypothetical protein